MGVCEIEEVTNVYGGMDGWDGGWLRVWCVLGKVFWVMCIVVVWRCDCGFVIILVF